MREWSDKNIIRSSKKRVAKLIYGRTLFMIMCIIAQIAIILTLTYNLSQYSKYIYSAYVVLNLLAIVVIFACDSDSTVKMTWLFVLIIFQPIGWVIYLYDRLDVGHLKIKKQSDVILGESVGFQKRPDEVYQDIKDKDLDLYNTCRYLSSSGGYHPYYNQGVKYFSTGREYLDSLLVDLSQAKKFIFLEYFIVDKGYMWDSILEVLTDRIKDGVEVRIMYDGINEFSNLPFDYPKQLQELGISCKVFDPIRPILSTAYDFRDHRKLAIIDGRMAYTGGINLADEYINRVERFGYWKDIGIRIQGQSVATCTRMFLENWNLHDDDISYGEYIRASEEINTDKLSGYIIPYGYCPLTKYRTGEQIYLNIINKATRYVHIMTPYFAIDQTMMDAMLYAARRGVEVVVIVPHIPDKRYMQHLYKSYYARLTDAGVKFYEYTPGFIHAKSIVADDNMASIGTVNMDYRSFYHHFENGVFIVEADIIQDMEADFRSTLLSSQAVTIASIKREKLVVKILGCVLRLVAPLL